MHRNSKSKIILKPLPNLVEQEHPPQSTNLQVAGSSVQEPREHEVE